MYGKIEANGKFKQAPANKVTKDGDKTIIEPMPIEELDADGYKEVYTAYGPGRPGPDKKPVETVEDKGDFILKRINWVLKDN